MSKLIPIELAEKYLMIEVFGTRTPLGIKILF